MTDPHAALSEVLAFGNSGSIAAMPSSSFRMLHTLSKRKTLTQIDD
jgi:hypothetical protein